MNSWPFVIAAYAITLVATFALLVSSFVTMRAAERSAEELKRSR